MARGIIEGVVLSICVVYSIKVYSDIGALRVEGRFVILELQSDVVVVL